MQTHSAVAPASPGVAAAGRLLTLPMTQIDPLACFADSYAEARGLFIAAAARAGGAVRTEVHPAAQGPDGGSLAMDVALLGPAGAPRGLLIVSGTHGPEGYTGSAAQVALMGSGALAGLPGDMRVVLVHAVNPFGFAHASRTTENNVDLNRNFIDFAKPVPRNPAYVELHPATCPAEWSEASLAESRRAHESWIQRNGLAAWMDAMMKGQYEEPTGLNFGGAGREWSNRTLEEIVRRDLAGVEKLAFIDWHTGLGEVGDAFFLCFNRPGDANWERCCAWWGRDRIETTSGFNGAKRPDYSGLVFHGVQGFAAPAEMAGAVIEFGTGPVQDGYEWLRRDRWVRFGERPADPALRGTFRAGMKEFFSPTAPAWRHGVVAKALDIQRAAIRGLAAW